MSSYYEVDEPRWLYAHAGVTGAITVPIAVLGMLTCFKGRKRADPSRTGFVWVQAAFALYFLTFIFAIVNSAAQAHYYEVLYSYYDQPSENLWNKISYSMSAVSGFFHWFADMALLISFVEIGNGFMYALTQTRTSKQKVLRNVAFALMLPLIIMAFVNVGYGGSLWSQYLNGTLSDSAFDKFSDLNYMYAAMNILLFIYSLLAMIYACIVRHKYRGIEPSSNTVTLYLVATILTTVPRSLWAMIYSCLMTFSSLYIYLDVDVPTRVILTQLVILITLVLLFVVSTRKQAGLWTTLQPWMNGVPPAMVSRNQLYYAVGPNGEPAYYQYPAGQAAIGYGQAQHQQYGWQPQQHWSQQQWPQQPQEVAGVPPNIVPAADQAHMLPASGPELRSAGHVHHEMKA